MIKSRMISCAYRFGFNGKENDNEVKGTGNQYDYGFRIYNPRLGRFLSIDPLTRRFPFYTPYQFAGNKPIFAIDLDGLEEYAYIYRFVGNERTLIQTIDYTKTKAGVGPLGPGTYVQVINEKGDKFSESFVTKDGNSIPSFSEVNINRANFKDVNVRLNAKLMEKTVENALVNDLGFDRKSVEADVQVLDSDNPSFVGKFATFGGKTASKYTENFTTRQLSPAHKSTDASGSGELNKSGVELKFYDGAGSYTDNIPNQVGFTVSQSLVHYFEAVNALLGTNIGTKNASIYKSSIEQKQTTSNK